MARPLRRPGARRRWSSPGSPSSGSCAAGCARPLFLAWSVFCIAVTAGVVAADGGVDSPLTVLFLLPVVFAALSYPLPSVAADRRPERADAGRRRHVRRRARPRRGSRSSPPRWPSSTVLCAWQAELADRRRRELALISRADPLTGCLNRRGFEERLAAELDEGLRAGRPLAVVMFDLDGFKEINDTQGHAAGDEILCWTVKTIEETIRPMDSVGRLGGDEFVVLLPASGHAGALTVAEPHPRGAGRRAIGATPGRGRLPHPRPRGRGAARPRRRRALRGQGGPRPARRPEPPRAQLGRHAGPRGRAARGPDDGHTTSRAGSPATRPRSASSSAGRDPSSGCCAWRRCSTTWARSRCPTTCCASDELEPGRARGGPEAPDRRRPAGRAGRGPRGDRPLDPPLPRALRRLGLPRRPERARPSRPPRASSAWWTRFDVAVTGHGGEAPLSEEDALARAARGRRQALRPAVRRGARAPPGRRGGRRGARANRLLPVNRGARGEAG